MRAPIVSLLAMFCTTAALAQPAPTRYVFDSAAKAGETAVTPGASAYDPARGYGLEGADGVRFAKGVQSKAPFFFSADAPEGNYKVTIVLGGPEASVTTVKAELRRLMIEPVAVPAGGSVTKSFIVNVRTPAYPGGAVRLKGPRESTQESVAWDERITLEFNGDNPAVRSLAIAPFEVPTIYILGDSTSTDQIAEPYASWGQMITAMFEPTVAVSNQGQSGESVAASNDRGRFAKILASLKPGDVFITQFGHNDMKEVPRNPAAPQQYRDNLMAWARAVQAKGATAVIVTPVQRHSFADGKVSESLAPYPQMAKDAAAASGATLIDLNASSKVLYQTLGDEPSWALFKHEADGTGRDGTHHSPYGAYEIAKLVVQGLRDARLPIAQHVRTDLPQFDPAKPAAQTEFRIPKSPTYTSQRPLGD